MPISSERYSKILEPNRARGTFSVDQFRAALEGKQLAGAMTDAAPESATVLQGLVTQAQEHGLEASDIEHALTEIKEQLDIEASTVARHEYQADRSKTSLLNIPRHIGLRWQGMLETVGRGKIAERAQTQRQQRLQDRGYLEAVTQAAIERASLRKRYQEYIRLGGGAFGSMLQQFIHGEINRSDLEQQPNFQEGIENILNGLSIPDPFVVGKAPDGTPIEVPLTRENEQLIRNHLRFILQDEVLQLAQLSQMKVMETQVYQVDVKKTSVIVSKLLGSATLWGMGIRTGGRLAIGGSIAAASFAATPAGWGVIVAAVGAGALAGYGSQVAQYHFERRKQKKMDLAIGASRESIDIAGTPVRVVKSAEQINTELQERIAAVHNAGNDKDRQAAIVQAYRIVMDAECRLLASRQGETKDRQDFISFGLEQRLQASLNLIKNLREAAMALRVAKTALPDDADFEQALKNAAHHAQSDIATVRANLERVLAQGEGQRRLLGAALGGAFGGLAATAMDYLGHWFSQPDTSPAQPPTFEHTTVATVHHGGEAFTVNPTAAGDPKPGLVIHAPGGEQQVVDLPVGTDPRHIVVSDDLHIYEAASGKPVGEIDLDFSAGVHETLKVPVLDTNLTMTKPHSVTVAGQNFGVVVDTDANLALYGMNPDHTMNVSEPLVPPQNVLAEDLHQKIDGMPANVSDELMDNATQLHVEVQDGTILVKSVYDQSIVAQFEPTPVSTTGDLLDRLYADPNSETAQLLHKMGVQPGEITTSAEGNITITDEVVKGEYLGNTAGWRQVRLELMLEAVKEGKLANGESADMVVARLERATRHLLLETDSYPDAHSVLQEAFGKEPTFIQANELPWINGPKSVVSNDWEKLVEAVRQLPDHASTQPGVGTGTGTAAGGIDGGVHPITSDTLFQPGQAGELFGQFVETPVIGTLGQSIAMNKAVEVSANAALALAGLALEQHPRQLSHLRGADAAPTAEHGTRLETYTFAEAPEQPTPVEAVDPAVAAEQDYNAFEAYCNDKLRRIDNKLIDVLRKGWFSHHIHLDREIEVLNLAQDLDCVVDQKELEAAAVLNESVAGKPFASLAAYIAHVRAYTAGVLRELRDVVQDRTEQFVSDVASLDVDSIVAGTNEANLTTALANTRQDLAYGNVVLQTLNAAFLAAPIKPAVVTAHLKLADAVARIEARLAELAAAATAPAPPKAPEPGIDTTESKRQLTAEFHSPAFAVALIVELEVQGMSATNQVSSIQMLLGNWGRLKRQLRYLQSLPNERLLAAIGIDLSEPTSVTRLVQKMQQALADTTKTLNIISLSTIPEYTAWYTAEKLNTIKNSFKLGRKFSEGLQAFATTQALKPVDFLVSLGWFNERWNTATLGQPLATAATEVKLKQLGCFDEHDVWDDAKVKLVFQHIVDKDQAWLDEVINPK